MVAVDSETKRSFVTKKNKTIRVDIDLWDEIEGIAKTKGEKVINTVERALRREVTAQKRATKT